MKSERRSLSTIGLIVAPIVAIVLISSGFVSSTMGANLTTDIMRALLVTIENDPAHPVPVRDVDQITRQPFHAQLNLSVEQNEDGGFASLDVPNDKLLVIEYVSARIPVIGSLSLPAHFRMSSTTGPDLVNHFLFTVLPQALTGTPPFQSAQSGRQVRLYADPGTTVNTAVGLSSTNPIPGQLNVTLALSGYLVDCSGGAPCRLP